VATTLRLPVDVEERLDAYCEAVGATKNRVTALALRTYLEMTAPALPVERDFVGRELPEGAPGGPRPRRPSPLDPREPVRRAPP
jgi:hypothetical protein